MVRHILFVAIILVRWGGTVMVPNPYGAPLAVPSVPHPAPVYVPQPGIRPIPQFAPLGQRCRQQFVPGVGWQQVCW